MNHSRLTLILVVGSMAVLTPLVSSFLHGAENSIFPVMTTLTEVKESLEEKRNLLEKLSRTQSSDPQARAREADQHFRHAREINDLTDRLLVSAQQKFPRYHAFLASVKERVGRSFAEIERLSRQMGVEVPGESAGISGNAGSVRAAPAAGTAERLNPVDGHQALPADTRAAAARPVEARAGDESDAAAEASPDGADVRKKYRRAYQLYVRGTDQDLAEAQQEFARILKADPRYHLARYWLSKIQFARGETEQARASARELVKAQPHLRIARELLKEVGADGTPTPEGPAPAKLAQARAPAPTESEEEPQESTKPQERPEGEPEGGLGGGMSGAKGPPSRTMPPGAPVRRHARAASPANGRPVAILVSWKGASSPPAGISGAYLVHEIPVAEQESRLLALFKGTPPASRIGPVAIYDQHLVALARAFGAVVAHLRPPVSSETLPESAATDLIDNRSVPTVFTTDTSGEGRSLVFANPSRLKAELDRRPAVQATAIGFPRLDSPITSGSMPSRLDIQQGYRSAVSFSYDPATGLYHRLSWQGQTAVDGADGSGLAAANVVVITQGTADRWAVEVHRGGTVSSGVLTNDPEAPLTTKKGTPLLLNPGQVWIVGQLAQPARAAAPRRKAASTKAARRAAPKAQPGPAATETPAEEAAPPEVAVSEDPEEPLDSKLYEPKAGGASPSRAEPADETGDDPAPRAKPAATRAKKPQRTAALKDLRAKVRAIAEEVN